MDTSNPFLGPLRRAVPLATLLVAVAPVAAILPLAPNLPRTPILPGAPFERFALSAQSGEEVLLESFERYQRRMEGIENYTVVQESMGFGAETYLERTEVDGRTVFVPRWESGGEVDGNAPGVPYGSLYELAERAERGGAEEVDGELCHRIRVNDFEGVDLWPSGPSGSAGGGGGPQAFTFTAEAATFFVDTDEYLIRRMAVTGRAPFAGQAREVSLTIDLRDFREVEGMTHPFILDVSITGLPGQSAEEEARMRQAMEQLRAQLESMPPEQRAAMERMLDGWTSGPLESLRTTGSMDLTMRVIEIRVNEGRPSPQETSSDP